MTVLLIVMAGFFLAAGGMMYAPVMPLHAIELGAPAWVGTAIPMGLPSLVAILFLLPIGLIADNTGKRKELLMFAALLTVLANIGLGLFADSWASLTILRLISGIPFAFMSMFGVILAFVLPAEKRGMAMGLGLGGAMLGMGLFQAISGTLLEMLGGSFSNLYFFAAGVTLLSFLCLLPAKVPVVKSTARISGKEFREVLSNRYIIVTGVTVCVYLVGWQMLYGSFPVVVTNILGASVQLQTVLFAVASIMLGFGTIIWGPVIDKLGGRNTLLLGISVSVIAIGVMILVSELLWPYVLLFWIATLGGVCGAPASTTIATKSVKKELTTVAANFMFIFVALTGILGGFAAGPVISALGLAGMLTIAAVAGIIGVLLMLNIPSEIKTPEQTVAQK
ncbi:MAG TPA: MFS transporter [Acidobacteriota bacterium]|nr:MFS transporter [Acidobacteriota bacterium]